VSLALRTLLVGSVAVAAAVGFGPLGCGSDQQISTVDPNAPGAYGGGLNLDGSLLDLDGNYYVQCTDIKISPTDAALTVQLGQTNVRKLESGQPELWIVAMSSNIQPGQGPSFPALYIAGQDENSINERPQFATPVCKEFGNSCEAGYECCDGFCRADAAGKFTCQKTNPNECARSGEVCKANADCRGGSCIGGTCQSVIAN
jgi:hypothetical protein